eukprot:scaffold602_cov147-Skeletonema_menzelii.AAC.1
MDLDFKQTPPHCLQCRERCQGEGHFNVTVLVVAAAGNRGDNSVLYPAAYRNHDLCWEWIGAGAFYPRMY